MKRWQIVIVAAGVVIILLVGFVWLQIRHLDVEQLTDDLYVLRGIGGNTAVLRTDAGAIIVDTMTLPMQGRRIRNEARKLTGVDPVVVINTHYHLDHTHGNPAFDPGTRVVATDRTLSHLKVLDTDFWTGDAAALLPGETFSGRKTLKVGGKTIELFHPGRGHTDGDLVVLFVDDRVVHMGDLLFDRHYPNIDLEAGGSVQSWPATLERVLAWEFERAIPGHGETTDRSGIVQFQRFMEQLALLGRDAAAAGATLEQTVATDRLTEDEGYKPIRFLFVPLGLDRAFVLRRAWEEATDNFTLANPGPAVTDDVSSLCGDFLEVLREVPHEALTVRTGNFNSGLDDKPGPGCRVRFATSDSLRGSTPIPTFEATPDSRMYRRGWQMIDDGGADGPGSGRFLIESEVAVCTVEWSQPSYVDEAGTLVQSDAYELTVVCLKPNP